MLPKGHNFSFLFLFFFLHICESLHTEMLFLSQLAGKHKTDLKIHLKETH